MTATTQLQPRAYTKVLLASDGSPAMEATILVAGLIAERGGAEVQVVTVVEPLPMVTPEANLPVTPELDERRRNTLKERVLEQLAQFAPASKDWPVQQLDGHPDATVVRMAHETKADLIVLGLGEHGIVDRWFGGETALRVLNLTNLPVLAVSRGARALPTRMLVAMDFSETSEHALSAALPLLGKGAKITLAHVVPRDISMGTWPAWDDAYENVVKAGFAQLRARLPGPALASADELVLYGDPGRELLQRAQQMRADLIVAGTRGLTVIPGTLLGRVSTKLIRGANCSVFILPPEKRAR
ncbi:MAG: universal stress protein [Gemmatimonadaceae bacterium]